MCYVCCVCAVLCCCVCARTRCVLACMQDAGLRSLVADVVSAVDASDGPSLALALAITTNGFHIAVMSRRCSDTAIDACCAPLQRLKWDAAYAAVVRAAKAGADKDWPVAHRHHLAFLAEFNKLLNTARSGWILPALAVAVVEAVALATAAERHVAAHADGVRHGSSEAVAERLSGTFRAVQDRAAPEASKKWGTLVVVNALLRLNLRVRAVRRCLPYVDSVVRLWEGAGDDGGGGAESAFPMARFPLAQTVTFSYYQGRLAMFDERFGAVRAACCLLPAACCMLRVGARVRCCACPEGNAVSVPAMLHLTRAHPFLSPRCCRRSVP